MSRDRTAPSRCANDPRAYRRARADEQPTVTRGSQSGRDLPLAPATRSRLVRPPHLFRGAFADHLSLEAGGEDRVRDGVLDRHVDLLGLWNLRLLRGLDVNGRNP